MKSAHVARTEIRHLTKLPEIDERNVPGWRITRRAVTMTLGIIVLLMMLAIATALIATVSISEDADGLLDPSAVWPVRSIEGGVLTEVLVRTGDTVSAGQEVMRLDTSTDARSVADIQVQIAAVRADIARLDRSVDIDRRRLEAGVEVANAGVDRARSAMRARMIDVRVTGDPDSIARAAGGRIHVLLDAASADLNGAMADAAAARAQLAGIELSAFDVSRKQTDMDRLELQLAGAKERIRRSTVRAPARGIVLTEQVERLLGSAIAPGQQLLELAELGGWRAILNVSERDIHRIHVGDRATVEIPALATTTDDRFDGRVLSVGWQTAGSSEGTGVPAGSTNTSGYRVVVALDEITVPGYRDGIMRRGYVVRGKIISRSGRLSQVAIEYFRDRARALTR